MDFSRYLTLGVEVEAIAYPVAEGADPSALLTHLAAILNGMEGIEAKVLDHGHTPGETAWIVTKDPTVTPAPDGIELISPVLEDKDDSKAWKDQISAVLSAFQDEFELTTNNTTGLHVHVGVSKGGEEVFTLEELKRIAAVVVVYEESLDEFHAVHRSTHAHKPNDHLLPLRSNLHLVQQADAQLGKHLLSAGTIPQLLGMVNPLEFLGYPVTKGRKARGNFDKQRVPTRSMRDYKVNFTSINKHGTVEFRQHAGTVVPEVICAWADFVLALVRRALALTDDEVKTLDATKKPLVPHIISLEVARAVKPDYVPERTEF